MKKIMFNDKYGLTEAVLSGRKTQTRRIIPKSIIRKIDEYQLQYFNRAFDAINEKEAIEQMYFVERSAKLPFQIGDTVAIAQSYKDAGVDYLPEEDDEFGCYNFLAEQTNGWTNKMFVRADLMPHRIRITNVRVERLQDISDEDCIAEGVIRNVHKVPTQAPQSITNYYPCQYLKDCANKVGWGRVFNTPQKAYANLIDAVSGNGTWESNPFVFVYDFELVK